MVIADYNGGQKYQDIPFNEKMITKAENKIPLNI